MEELIREINAKTSLIAFLKASKYSRGLNSHDIKIYESAKKELVNLKTKLEQMENPKQNKLIISQNI